MCLTSVFAGAAVVARPPDNTFALFARRPRRTKLFSPRNQSRIASKDPPICNLGGKRGDSCQGALREGEEGKKARLEQLDHGDRQLVCAAAELLWAVCSGEGFFHWRFAV